MVIARSGLTARFPARFTLVLAANPCPCARTAATGSGCTCAPLARRRYLARLSGPLLDRVDVKVELLPVGRAELLTPAAGRAERGGGGAGAGGEVTGGQAAGGDAVAAERGGSGQRAAAELPSGRGRARAAGACHGSRPDQRAGSRPDHPDVVDACRSGRRGAAADRGGWRCPGPVARGGDCDRRHRTAGHAGAEFPGRSRGSGPRRGTAHDARLAGTAWATWTCVGHPSSGSAVPLTAAA